MYCMYIWFWRIKIDGGQCKNYFLLHVTKHNIWPSTHVLKLWAQGKDDPDMAKIAKECEEDVYDLWRECVAEEKIGQTICPKTVV